MKRLLLALTLLSVLCLYACAKVAEYRNDIDTEDILKGAPHTVRSADEYSEYDDDFVEFFFGELSASRDHTILYSKQQNNINEVGIFHAANEEEALEIYEKTTEYISELQETQRAFIASYAANELPKLDSATVERYGNYVIYAILPADDREALFSHVESTLKS